MQKENMLFQDYFIEWVNLYKSGAVRDVTITKYKIAHKNLIKLAPILKISELDRKSYQKLLNDYALTHEKQTTMDFHHLLKGSILDALEEGYIDIDPTRKVVIKGKPPRKKKIKYLNQFELQKLVSELTLNEVVSWDWLILLIAKTGLRFSEALALTPEDFDFTRQVINVSKTWDYKSINGGFEPTKNKASMRKVQIDWHTTMQLNPLLKELPKNDPIFVSGRVFNSTINNRLKKYCEKANIPVISVHGLRHTHASLLLFAGVSIASVAHRLGHSNMTTTQKTYLHVIQELENQDNDKVMRYLSALC